jgi:MFS family permease
LIDRYGRRPVLFLYYFIGAFFHLWLAMSTGLTTFVAAFLVGWVNPGVYGSTGVYGGELDPTHIRAAAVGWSARLLEAHVMLWIELAIKRDADIPGVA